MRAARNSPAVTAIYALAVAAVFVFGWLLGGTSERGADAETADFRAGFRWAQESAADVDACARHAFEFERGCLAAVAEQAQVYADER